MKTKWIIFGLLGMAMGACGQEIPASKVSVSVKGEPVESVLKTISEVSGNMTVSQQPGKGGEGSRVDFEAKDEAYWSVIKRFCEGNGMTVVQPGEEFWNAVNLGPGSGMAKMPTSMSGGSLFQIKGARVSMRQDFTGTLTRTATFEMLMYSEPKAGVFKVAQAAGDNGKSQVIKSGNEDPKFSSATTPTWHRFEVTVNYEPGVKRLKTLSGKIWVIQEVKSEEWTIEETGKAAGMKRTVCDLDELKVLKLAVENNFVVLEMELAPAGQQEETLLSPETMARRVRYEGPEKQPDLRSNMGGTSVRREGTKMIRQMKIQSFPKTYGDVKMPEKVMIRVPTEVKAVAVPFEFQDVELP